LAEEVGIGKTNGHHRDNADHHGHAEPPQMAAHVAVGEILPSGHGFLVAGSPVEG